LSSPWRAVIIPIVAIVIINLKLVVNKPRMETAS